MTTSIPLALGFVGENANGTLAVATEWVNSRLREHGIESLTIDFNAPDWNDKLKNIMTTRQVAFAYGFAGVGSVLRNGNQSFWTAFRTPFLSLMYDHPFYNLPNHMVDSPFVGNCYFIPDYAEAQQNYVKNPHPCFVLREGFYASPVPPGAWKDRTIPYILAKTGGDVRKMDASVAELSKPEQNLFHECLRELQTSSEHFITHLVGSRAQAMKTANFGTREFGRMVVLLDRRIRDWRSRQLVEFLKHKPAIIIGDGWDDIDKKHAQAKFLPSMPMDQVAQMYCDSRFVFNANPYSCDGHHERVTMAVNTGAVAVSDRNRFSDQNFAPMKSFISFDWGDPDWAQKLDTRLVEFEKSGGNFDPATAQNHLKTVFPIDLFIQSLVSAAAKIGQNNGLNL